MFAAIKWYLLGSPCSPRSSQLASHHRLFLFVRTGEGAEADGIKKVLFFSLSTPVLKLFYKKIQPPTRCHQSNYLPTPNFSSSVGVHMSAGSHGIISRCARARSAGDEAERENERYRLSFTKPATEASWYSRRPRQVFSAMVASGFGWQTRWLVAALAHSTAAAAFSSSSSSIDGAIDGHVARAAAARVVACAT